MRSALALFAFLCSFVAQGAPSEVPPAPSYELTGEIATNAVQLANKIVNTLRDPAFKPGTVQLIINSPGGSVIAADALISAMTMAQSRGWRFRCSVPFVAASAAFQIFAHCDERVAMQRALLLWHPVRQIIVAMVTPAIARQMAEELGRVEARLIRDLRSHLPVSDADFMHNYTAESLLVAEEVNAMVGDVWVEITDDIPGLKEMYPVRPGAPTEEDRAGQIVWQAAL